MNIKWVDDRGSNGITYILNVQRGQDEISVERIHLWHGIAHLFRVRVLRGRGRGRVLPVIVLRVQVGSRLNEGVIWCATWDEIENVPTVITNSRREISNEGVAHKLAVRTHWEFELVKARSVSNQQHMEWHYEHTESSKWSKRGQYHISSGWNGITHILRV